MANPEGAKTFCHIEIWLVPVRGGKPEFKRLAIDRTYCTCGDPFEQMLDIVDLGTGASTPVPADAFGERRVTKGVTFHERELSGATRAHLGPREEVVRRVRRCRAFERCTSEEVRRPAWPLLLPYGS